MSDFVMNMDDKETFVLCGPPWKDPAMQDRLTQATIDRIKQVHAQREAILEAVMAETGCMPSECEQVQVTEGTTIHWFVRRRKLAAALRPFGEVDE